MMDSWALLTGGWKCVWASLPWLCWPCHYCTDTDSTWHQRHKTMAARSRTQHIIHLSYTFYGTNTAFSSSSLMNGLTSNWVWKWTSKHEQYEQDVIQSHLKGNQQVSNATVTRVSLMHHIDLDSLQCVCVGRQNFCLCFHVGLVNHFSTVAIWFFLMLKMFHPEFKLCSGWETVFVCLCWIFNYQRSHTFSCG